LKYITTDVLIAGGGLAGLSLAYQLKITTPELSIIVIERNTFPIPNIIAKVGESTVELASHYFTDILGLGQHFKESHLHKHGLRCFFGEPQNDFSQQDELGVSQLFGLPSYQLDRGVTENYLYQKVLDLGVQVVDGALTKNIELGKHDHQLTVQTGDGTKLFQSRWLIDAAGRQKLISNKLGLNKPSPHKGNAVWFRVDRRIIIDEWSDNDAWKNRIEERNSRWLSTNHLTGPGYWVWIIPLATGATSIGIVMDDQAFEESGISNFDNAYRWLEKHQPKCAAALSGADVLDFCAIRDYSYGCTKMFSDDGWCLTGEAGAFTDPFYSPGSDFIAINNTFITHLIGQEKRGEDIRLNSVTFHLFYDSFFENTLSLYTDEYGGFGDRRMMGVKLLWDYSYYWGVLTLLFYKQAIVDRKLIISLNPLLNQARELNIQVQSHLRTRAKKRLVLPAQGIFLDQQRIPCLNHFNDTLKSSSKIDIHTALIDNIAILHHIAKYAIEMLDDNASLAISSNERDLLGDYRQVVLA